jgi:DNA-binding NtrC family response regulator
MTVMSRGSRVLVVDDEVFVRDSLCAILKSEGFVTGTASSSVEALRLLAKERFEAIVTDLRMPGGDGLSLLSEARQRGVAIPIILITGVGTVAEAVAAMKTGAFDFLQKPVDPAELVLVVQRAVEHHALLAEVRELRDTVAGLRGPRVLVGSSPAMANVKSSIAQVAPTDATVLITGESGTGKEIAAEQIHGLSGRADKGLTWVQCATLTEMTFESELFGHRKGATPGALADRIGRFAEAAGGTLVLNEIGTLSSAMQAKLLRVLETGEYQVAGDASVEHADVRVIATTNEDLAAKVKSGAFRSDLYYRLAQFPIEMPALRNHKQDIGEISENLLSRARATARGGSARLSIEARELLASYGWPGNVRELRNVLERAVIVSDKDELDAGLFAGILESTSSSPFSTGATAATGSLEPREFHLRTNLDAAEREIVLRALTQSKGKKKEAANLLGIDPRNLGYYLRKHKITDKESAEAGGR